MNTDMKTESTPEVVKEQVTKNLNIEEWDDAEELRNNILRGIYAYGFEKPSPIQKRGILPMITKGKNGKRRDIIAQAQSGTGKTGCFSVGVLNIVNRLIYPYKDYYPYSSYSSSSYGDPFISY